MNIQPTMDMATEVTEQYEYEFAFLTLCFSSLSEASETTENFVTTRLQCDILSTIDGERISLLMPSTGKALCEIRNDLKKVGQYTRCSRIL